MNSHPTILSFPLKMWILNSFSLLPLPPLPLPSPPRQPLAKKSYRQNLTNWRPFFMRLSCYWSWISSKHCQSSCGSADHLIMLWRNNNERVVATQEDKFPTLSASQRVMFVSWTARLSHDCRLRMTSLLTWQPVHPVILVQREQWSPWGEKGMNKFNCLFMRLNFWKPCQNWGKKILGKAAGWFCWNWHGFRQSKRFKYQKVL